MPKFSRIIILLIIATLGNHVVDASQTECDVNGCVITVDWALDVEPDSSTATCDYTQGGLFRPDTTGEGAGRCTLRRAIREAGARSDDSICPGCSPITIQFSGLDGDNGDADDSEFNGFQWVLRLDGNASAADHFRLRGQSILDTKGDITITGPFGRGLPEVFINTSATLEVELSNVKISQLGFIGGIGVVFKEPDGEFSDNLWGIDPNGQDIYFQDPINNADALAGAIGVSNTLNGDNLLVTNNTFAGASTKAIEIRSMSSGAVITNNAIGTNASRRVPLVPENLKCRGFSNPFNPTLDPREWFGGWGISVAGSGAVIQDNLIVGLQNIRSLNDTPPIALEVFGGAHTIAGNTIGLANPDEMGNFDQVGVCGQGIKFSSSSDPLNPMSFGHTVLNNLIVAPRNGFENTTGAILWTDTSLPPALDGGNTVRGNLVINGPERYFEMGPNISTATKSFEPGEITDIDGLVIEGRADQSNVLGAASPCPNCIIDFYLDDLDANEEALAYLGSTTAAGNGRFSYMLPEAIPAGFGIRTTSTAQANNVIGNTWAGTTSEMSSVVFAPAFEEEIFSNGFES